MITLELTTNWLQFDFSDSEEVGGIGFWVWAATILYPSSKHTAPCKKHALMSGESIRVFPLSNWMEVDVWYYLKEEDMPIVPIYC